MCVCMYWRSALIVPLYKGKGERNEYKNYRGVRLLRDRNRVHRVTWSLIDVEQGCFRKGRDCIDQIFTLKQIGEKAYTDRQPQRFAWY